MKEKPSPQEYEVVEEDKGAAWFGNLVGTLFAILWLLVILTVTGLKDLVCWICRRLSKSKA